MHRFEIDAAKRRLSDAGGGYEIVHRSPGLELGVYVLGGSILEGDPSSRKLHNTSTFFRPDGQMSAVYRKIHLFDVKAPDREYLESDTKSV